MDGVGEHRAKMDRPSKANTFVSYTEYRLMTLKYGEHYLGGGEAQENVMWDK